MDGQNYVVFHAGTDNSYMNSTANFRGADVGATFLDLYFLGSTGATDTVTGYDKVRLTVTAASEEAAMEAVGGALAGAKNPVTVIADDNNSIYVHDKITAVASITLGSRVQTRVVENIATTKSIEASDSGKWFTIDQDSAFAITLPTVAQAGAGWYADFCINDEGANAVTIIPDTSEDVVLGFVMSGDGGTGSSTDSTAVDEIKFISGAQKGDRVYIFCDGTSMYAYCFAHDAAHIEIA